MEAQNQPAARTFRDLADARRQPRFKLDAQIRINTKTCGVLEGRTVDISESGISAMLKLEVPVGEFVELQFTLPFGPVTVYALVRQRNAFRYGFQFVESNTVHEIIQTTCRSLELEQSQFGGNK
ncbi:MAG TPA: PilZ domain-containing protein [Candidatus Deferrimicrobiaceae bacterium]|nr:PilZ domain-containing protein [Candidatus Deferrimicrobiaceae bacterium]